MACERSEGAQSEAAEEPICDIERLSIQIQKLGQRHDRLLNIILRVLKIDNPTDDNSDVSLASLRPDDDDQKQIPVYPYPQSWVPFSRDITRIRELFLAQYWVDGVGSYSEQHGYELVTQHPFLVTVFVLPKLVLRNVYSIEQGTHRKILLTLPWWQQGRLHGNVSYLEKQLVQTVAPLVKERWPSHIDARWTNRLRRPLRLDPFLDYKELTYNDDGYPVLSPDARPAHSKPWTALHFGRIWIMGHPHVVDFQAIAVLVSQLSPPAEDNTLWQLGEELALVALGRFTSMWSPLNQFSQCLEIGSGWFHLQFHLRFCSVTPGPDDSESSKLDGLRVDRDGGKLEALLGSLPATIAERRHCIIVHTSTHSRLPVYTILVLSDEPVREIAADFSVPAMRKQGRFAGIAVFQHVLHQILLGWHKEWTAVLDRFINSSNGIQISTVLSPNNRERLMFDASLGQTYHYFMIIQLLRIFSSWIKEAEESLTKLIRQWDSVFEDLVAKGDHNHDPELLRAHAKIVKTNWEVLIPTQQALAKELLGRIEKKEGDMNKLRDGLLTMTSAHEASKGSTLNRYILIFTIMTIVYLPLSFVATLFGMHLFDSDELRKTQTSFFISTVTISIATYAFSGFGLWIVNCRQKRQGRYTVEGEGRMLAFELLPEGETLPSREIPSPGTVQNGLREYSANLQRQLDQIYGTGNSQDQDSDQDDHV